MTIKAESIYDNFDEEEIYKEHFEDAINIAEILGEEENNNDGKLFNIVNTSIEKKQNAVIKELSEENPSEILDSCDYEFNK
jgi:hypothetical protein